MAAMTSHANALLDFTQLNTVYFDSFDSSSAEILQV